jgi:hypothetical protein
MRWTGHAEFISTRPVSKAYKILIERPETKILEIQMSMEGQY